MCRNVRVTQDTGSLDHTQDADDFQRNEIRRSLVLEESYELIICRHWVSGAHRDVSQHDLLNDTEFFISRGLGLVLSCEGTVLTSTILQCEEENPTQLHKNWRNKETNETHLTICLCLSTQYLIALLTSISCFFVNPFGPTPPLKVIPAVGRKVAVKSCRLLYILRRSRSSILSLWGGAGGGAVSDVSRRWSALPAYIPIYFNLCKLTGITL